VKKRDLRIKLRLREFAWASAGEGKGALAPSPGRPKIVCFCTFLGKIVSFLLFFRQKVGSCPPLENFCPSLEKVCGRPCEFVLRLFFCKKKSSVVAILLYILFPVYHSPYNNQNLSVPRFLKICFGRRNLLKCIDRDTILFM
jgi:hypothetical protein